jgi:hypothetical protein
MEENFQPLTENETAVRQQIEQDDSTPEELAARAQAERERLDAMYEQQQPPKDLPPDLQPVQTRKRGGRAD